jgi:hypothetical protein
MVAPGKADGQNWNGGQQRRVHVGRGGGGGGNLPERSARPRDQVACPAGDPPGLATTYNTQPAKPVRL